MSKEALTYKSTGVDVAAGDAASSILFEAARLTWANRASLLGEIQSLEAGFRTSRFFIPSPEHLGLAYGLGFDGVGTKIELAERLQSYRSIARDLLAMVCDDAAIQGAEPLVVGSVLDTASVNHGCITELAEGLVDAAREARVAVINGELAELPGRVAGYGDSPVNWSAACLWAGWPEKIRALSGPSSGDAIIAIRENGFRSNGLSLVRAIFRSNFGEHWNHHTLTKGQLQLANFALQPSTIYTRFATMITGGIDSRDLRYPIKAIVHITGGGLFGRLKHFCRTHRVGATVTDLPAPPAEMCDIQKLGVVSTDEAYRTWNMGTGLLVVCQRAAVTAIREQAELAGLDAVLAGVVSGTQMLDIRCYDSTQLSEQI